MEYFTTSEQEARLQAEYQRQRDEEQDRLRRSRTISSFCITSRPLSPPDRLFFVEPNGHIYLGEVKAENECPHHRMAGGASYGVDAHFLKQVQDFTARHERYVVVFQMKKDYSPYAEIYPARMICDTEELVLEQEQSHLS